MISPVAFWGCLRAGVIPVPINMLLTAETVRYILADSRAEAVVISADVAATLGTVLGDVKHVIVAQPDGGAPCSWPDTHAGPPFA